MTETPTEKPELSADDALKRRLLNRIAIAAIMVVGLLGSLAMFDAIYAPSRLPPPKIAQKEVPEPAVPADSKPAEAEQPAAESKPEPPPTVEPKPEPPTVAKQEEPAVPEGTAAPGAPPLQPLPPEKHAKALTKPATGRPASIRPSQPLPPAESPAARPQPARELAAPPLHGTPPRAPASRPISGIPERQFVLQMGVFGNVQNAEDLRAKLELNGVRASIEARVYAGPFASREEAEAMRAKLKELGLDGGLLVSVKK